MALRASVAERKRCGSRFEAARSVEIGRSPHESRPRLSTMPSELFRTSTTWVVDFRYEGRPRRWFKVFGPEQDVRALMSAELRQLYGDRARLVEVRKATGDEESQYLRGEEPKNAFCPTGRGGSDSGASGPGDP